MLYFSVRPAARGWGGRFGGDGVAGGGGGGGAGVAAWGWGDRGVLVPGADKKPSRTVQPSQEFSEFQGLIMTSAETQYPPSLPPHPTPTHTHAHSPPTPCHTHKQSRGLVHTSQLTP